MRQGNKFKLRDESIYQFLENSIYLESLTLFLYTWRLVQFLEKEVKNVRLKRLYRIFSIVTILLLPLAFYLFFTAFAVEQGKYNEYFYFGKFKELPEIGSIATKLLKVFGFLILTSNLLSCVILVLVLRQIHTILRSVNNGTEVADA